MICFGQWCEISLIPDFLSNLIPGNVCLLLVTWSECEPASTAGWAWRLVWDQSAAGRAAGTPVTPGSRLIWEQPCPTDCQTAGWWRRPGTGCMSSAAPPPAEEAELFSLPLFFNSISNIYTWIKTWCCWSSCTSTDCYSQSQGKSVLLFKIPFHILTLNLNAIH